MTGEVKIELEKDIDLSNAMVIEGFPSVGVISTIATSYLVKALDLEYVGSINYPGAPNAAVIIDGIPLPPLRIYARTGPCGPDSKCGKLVVMYSESAIPQEVMSDVSKAILDWCEEKECGLIVSFEGIPTVRTLNGDEVGVYGIGSTDPMLKLIDRYKIEKVQNGVVMGISGLLLVQSRKRNQGVLCILADADPRFPDSNGAVKLIEVVDALIPQHKIDPEPLRRDAEALEASIREAMEQASKSAGQSPEVPRSMYG